LEIQDDCGILFFGRRPIPVSNEHICVNFGAHHTTVTGAQNHTFGKIKDGGGRHLRFGLLTSSRSPVKVFSSNLVRTQILPYGDAAKITLFVKFKMVAIGQNL